MQPIHTKVSIVNELIRLTNIGLVSWKIQNIPTEQHNYHQKPFDKKHKYVKYSTFILNKEVVIVELSDKPTFIQIEGCTYLSTDDKELNSYITNPIISLWKSINTSQTTDPMSIFEDDFLTKLVALQK
jgi:hypothetical protein